MYSRRQPNPKFADLTDDWQAKINDSIEYAWTNPACRRASTLHLVEPPERYDRRMVKVEHVRPAMRRRS